MTSTKAPPPVRNPGMSSGPRTPAGTRAGGRFATTAHTEPDIGLGPSTAPARRALAALLAASPTGTAHLEFVRGGDPDRLAAQVFFTRADRAVLTDRRGALPGPVLGERIAAALTALDAEDRDWAAGVESHPFPDGYGNTVSMVVVPVEMFAASAAR